MREIYKFIDNLDNNKAPGPGYINAWALKSGKYAIWTHLRIILNNCIQGKVFPTNPKDVHITPIFKKGDFSVVANYRQISVTATFAKVFERLLLNQLVQYPEKLALLNKKYFDFHSRKSSTDVVLYFIEKIIGNKEYTDTGAVFLDLAKAFSSFSHEIFLKKLKISTSLNQQPFFSILFSKLEQNA